jgi:hypothetical protein
MREALTAISFLLVILVPTLWAAKIAGVTIEREKKSVPKKPPQRVDGTTTLFGNAAKPVSPDGDDSYERRA